MKKSANVQLRIPIGLYERIEKAATKAKSEKNDFIRLCLDQYLREHCERDEALLERIREIVADQCKTLM